MQIVITKGRDEDLIAVTRDDGSTATTRFPHKGPVPHDAVHWFVERALGFRDGFWGQVARGLHPEEVGAMAKAGGHASAKRAQVPDPAIVEMIQAERLVECFEADFWDGGADDASFVSVASAGCAASNVAMPAIDSMAVGRTRQDIRRFAEAWRTAPIGHSVAFEWP